LVSHKRKISVWWQRSGIALRLGLSFLVGTLIIILVYLQRPSDDTSQVGGNLFIFFLVNSIIVVLCLLAFLIGRNVVKLIFDRRKKILGSKLRMRLVLAFVGLTLIPTAIIFVLASGLLSSAMEGWFSGPIESSFNNAVEVAKQYHQVLRDDVRRVTGNIREDLNDGMSLSSLENYFDLKRQSDDLFSIEIVDSKKKVIVKSQNAAGLIDSFSEPDLNEASLSKALNLKEIVVIAESKSANQFVRGYVPLVRNGQTLALIVSKRISPDLSHALTEVHDSFQEYEQIKIFRNPLKSAYILTLTMITGLILFAAVWFGFHIAKQVTGPIQKLAEGTRAVARGNYDFEIKDVADDELGVLVRSFNEMISDLKQSRQDAEQKRNYLETVLANLAVAVITLDSNHRITAINAAALKLFAINTESLAIDKLIEEFFDGKTYTNLKNIISQVEQKSDNSAPVSGSHEFSITVQRSEKRVVCTAGKVFDGVGDWLATVLIFDDITELVKAQHMSAWREVAQRIAHEIKNPLTPIQLSAQRLERLLAGHDLQPAVSECSSIIVENVNSIKRLANEFSKYARMPLAELNTADLNNLISDTILPFAESHQDVVFQFVADNKLPLVLIDSEQIRRILINLLDNAIAAFEYNQNSENSPRVVIKTIYDPKKQSVAIEVADNASGIPEADKIRIFEPYYTTKTGGTGLGLAIVTSIVADHQGQIRVVDNQPRGAKFIVDLPISPRQEQARKIGGG
jgi:two-component system, NtrC family, nitrogen regulation sensor histidine kinase NtrY